MKRCALFVLVVLLSIGHAACNSIQEPESFERTSFVLENRSGKRIYIQRNNELLESGPFKPWLSLARNGADIHYHWNCAVACPCDGGPCVACNEPIYSTRPLYPGQKIVYTWSGLHYRASTYNGRECHEPAMMEPGSMEATFCYGFETERVEKPGGLPRDEFIVDRQCETVPFEYGRDRFVRLIVRPPGRN